jgi:hypothetical protein
MFIQIYKVHRTTSGSDIFTAYFEKLTEALSFAKGQREKLKDDFVHVVKHHFDGSFVECWLGDIHEITVDDDSWVSDWPGTIQLFPLGIEFETLEECKKFIKHSQKCNQLIIRSRKKFCGRNFLLTKTKVLWEF